MIITDVLNQHSNVKNSSARPVWSLPPLNPMEKATSGAVGHGEGIPQTETLMWAEELNTHPEVL